MEVCYKMKKTVLITGVSGGIGKELADRFAKGGFNLVLVARSEGKLFELAKEYRKRYGSQATVIAKDVASSGVPEEIFAELKEKGIVVDYLVNNAGFGLYGTFLETHLEQETNMIDVNIKALTVMTKMFLPDMVKRGQGGVMNVASVVAFFPGTYDVGLLRNEGVRAVVHRGFGERVERHRSDCDGSMSGTYVNRLR